MFGLVYPTSEQDQMTDCNHKGSANRESMSYNGLINQGSTCYLNSVLQVLFMTKEFREAVERYACNSKTLDFHLKDLFSVLKISTATTYELTKVLGISRDYLQSDAAECFENILNKVTNSEASQLFQGMQTTKNKCSKCNKETSSQEPFWSLPLHLEDSNDYYCVADGIDKYFKESNLIGNNQVYCEHCSTKSDTSIKVEIKYHPEVLTLLLKRFKFDYCYKKHVKVRRSVKIPELLQIPPFEDMCQFYQLYAFVEHTGDLKSGHYTVTIKAQDDDSWYIFDDSVVFPKYSQPFRSNDSALINSNAYLLFYRKIPGTNPLNVDDSGSSTSECCKLDQPNRNGTESKGEKFEEDHLMPTDDKSPENIKLLETDSNNSNMGRKNKQVLSDTMKNKEVVDNLQNEQHNLDTKQGTGGKPDTSLCDEDSCVFNADTREKHGQTQRQEQKKAAAGAECRGSREKEGVYKGENQNGNIKIDKQKLDQEKIVYDFRSENKPLTKYDLVQMSQMRGSENNTQKGPSEYEKNKTAIRDGTGVCSRTQGNSSNEQTLSKRREGNDGHLTSRTDQHQKNLVSNRENPGRTEMSFVLSNPSEGNKPSQKRKISKYPQLLQQVEICGKLYEICEIIADDKNENYLLLKESCKASGEDFSKQNPCRNPECKINRLRNHNHTDSSEEPCRKASEWKRNATKMQTGRTSQSYSCGSEVSQETGRLNQPIEKAAFSSCVLKQNEIPSSFLSSTGNENLEKEVANAECNGQAIHPSKEIKLQILQGYGGTYTHCQQSSGCQMLSDLQRMSLKESPNKYSNQGGSAKGGTCTGNHPITESNDVKNAIYSEIQEEAEKTGEDGKKRSVCSTCFS